MSIESDLEVLKGLNQYVYDLITENIAIFQMDDPRREWVIQGVIQRAVKDEGWAYHISCTFPGTPYGKIITKNADGTIWYHQEHAANSPTTAILAAYVACLQELA